MGLNENPIEISVVIPTRNCLGILPRVLMSLQHQDYPPEKFEVVVVDDGSEDATPVYLEKFAAETTLNFKFFRTEHAGPAAARNKGVAEAKGNLLFFMDADIILAKKTIRQHVVLQEQLGSELVCVMGKIEMAPELDTPEQVRVGEFEIDAEPGAVQQLHWWKYRTPNSSIQRVLFIRVGGFDTEFLASEDVELAYRMMKQGMTYWYDGSIRATHHHPMNLEGYLEKGALYGQAAALWYNRNPEIRRDLARYFGLYYRQMPVGRKVRHSLKVLLVNRFSLPLILWVGRRIGTYWLAASRLLYATAFRYLARKTFSQYKVLLS